MAKVLLVEDDNNLREIYQARLMAEGYDIVTAQNGEDALVVAKQNKPDLIISDVMMPRISGFEMLDILRNTAELKTTKVIMLTALGQAEDQARADNLGADKYLVKSQVTLEDIVNTAKELLDDGSSTTSMTEPAAAPAPVATPAPVSPPITPPTPVVPVTPVAAPPVEPVIPAAVPEPVTAPAQPQSVTPAPAAPTTPVVEPVTPPAVTAAPAPVATPAPEPVTTPAATDTTSSEVSEPVTPQVADMPVMTAPLPTSNAEAVVAPTLDPASDAVADSVPQSLEAEEAALQAQIDSFAKGPASAPASAPPTPADAPSGADPAVATNNDETIKNAVEELNDPTPTAPLQPPSVTEAPVMPEPPTPPAAPTTPVVEPVTPPAVTAAPAPVATPAPEAPAGVAGKKIIQPLVSNSQAPDLNALLAKEEAKEAVPTPEPAATVAPATTPPVTTPPATPGQSIDPNTVAL